jgi:hypothetical protein
MATGWLGWSPHDAWHTPMPEMFVALDARIEWHKMTNPFGGKSDKKPEKEKPKPMKEFIAKILNMQGTKVHGH